MPNAEKVEKVAVLKERIEGSQALLLAEYRGLSVHDATELRRSLGETTEFSVVKNTLMSLAASEAGVAELDPLLQGPTAVAFVAGDPVSAAKKVVEAAKKFPTLILKGAYLEGKVLFGEQAQALATLESREVMLSKIAGMLKGEMSRAASMFQALQSRFLGVLEAYKEKLPVVEAAVEPEAEVTAPQPEAATEVAADAAATWTGTPQAEAEGESGDTPVAASDAAEGVAPESDTKVEGEE